MTSLPTACALSALLLMLLSGCASSPPPLPIQRPPAPAELMTPAPPPGCFVMQIERILSRSPGTPTPSATGCEPASSS